MKRKITVASLLLVSTLLLSGCSNEAGQSPDSPLVSTAQGLGEPKVVPPFTDNSQFTQLYDSTNGAVDFRDMDKLDWEVTRVFKADRGEKLLPGDNFKATAQSNLTYNESVKEWVEALKKDGWVASNEVKPEPAKNEEQFTGSKMDYRWKAYSVDLTKGKSTINVDIVPEQQKIILKINSQ